MQAMLIYRRKNTRYRVFSGAGITLYLHAQFNQPLLRNNQKVFISIGNMDFRKRNTAINRLTSSDYRASINNPLSSTYARTTGAAVRVNIGRPT